MARPTGEHPGLRRPWSRSERPVPRRVLQPLQSFLAEEAAGGVFLLCSPWSNYIHGQVLNVTGGQFTGMTS